MEVMQVTFTFVTIHSMEGVVSHGSHPGLWMKHSDEALARVIALCFWGKTLYSHSASLQPGVEMRTGEFNLGVTLLWTSFPIREE